MQAKKILLVKTSSLGDLIHSFPALTDAARVFPGIKIDWLVEEDFIQVPAWHPAVDQVIPIALRRWRKNWRKARRKGELAAFKRTLQASEYDLVIDAQGLLKSAIPARLAHGSTMGYDRASIREPLASSLYKKRFRVSRDLHAIERIRRLFSLALEYPLPTDKPDYGLNGSLAGSQSRDLVFLHATTWPSKHWPESHWTRLAQLARAEGYRVHFPWHGLVEQQRVQRIITAAGNGELLPQMSLTELKDYLAGVAGAVGVDSGLAHITASVNTPAVTLYGPTSAVLTGATGIAQQNLQSDYECAPCLQKQCSKLTGEIQNPPCFDVLTPEHVWQTLLAGISHQTDDIKDK